jgi:threonine synthase
MHYHSTRGLAPVLDFRDTVLAGLASDGGLYLPETLPHFSPAELLAMQGMEYDALFGTIMARFGVPELADFSYRDTFGHSAIAPLKQLGANDWLLELFHGPTLAFKDFALQFLGRLVDNLLSSEEGSNPSKARREAGGLGACPQHSRITILGATSGDTGSAAIAGCRGRSNMRIVILHPHGRTSEVQRRQMTTVLDDNVHNIAIEGSFDDCQNIVKALFTDAEFRAQQRLTAVNSINWARILAQVVYYFYAALRLGAPAREVSFCVPTGNFGDIYAGWLAKRMGLPVKQLMIASNRNDILTRCVQTGEYRNSGVEPSLSPSMDIQISSNFERLLFEFYGNDAVALRALMEELKTTGGFTLRADVHAQLARHFAAHAVSDAQTLETIRQTHATTGEVLDPHTAVGVRAAQMLRSKGDTTPIITLATAHPAKFPDAVKQALGFEPPLPAHLADLFTREERYSVLPASVEAVKAHVGALS